jgi:hypothetical protein
VATNVSTDEILDGMVTALASLVPATGDPITPTAYVRSIGRYMGSATLQEMFQDGSAGRTPALQVAFESSRRVSSTTARRVDRIAAIFAVHCITDNKASRDRRALILRLAEDVRRLVGARALGLEIKPMRWQGVSVGTDNEQGLDYVVRFETVYHVDYTINPGLDVMESATGDAFTPETDDEAARELGEIEIALNQESA